MKATTFRYNVQNYISFGCVALTIEDSGWISILPYLCLSDLKAILKWNSSIPLSYQVFLYEEKNIPKLKNLTSPTFICSKENCSGITNTVKKTKEVTGLAHLLVVIRRPTFTEQLYYNINGNLVFHCDDKNVNLMFPTVEISTLDATSLNLHNLPLASGDTKDIITVISCSKETELVMIFPQDWANSFDSTLEILCSLTKVNVTAACRKLFVTHRISVQFDDCLLLFHAPSEANLQTYSVTIYSRDDECLLSLLHHLHQNIPGVLIIPKTLYEHYILEHPECISVEKETSELRDCIRREINAGKMFLHKSENPDKTEAYNKFADFQMDTDLHYTRLLKATSRD